MAETYSQLISTQDSCKYIYFNWLQHVPTDYWLNSLVQLLQQLVTVHRPATQPYTIALTTGYSVPATQPCTLASNNWLQSVPAGTGYTALYTCFNYWLQSVPAGTCDTALYTCFNNWLQSVPAGTGYTALYTCFNLRVTSLLTGYWLHSPYCTVLQPNWLHIKKKIIII